MSDPMMGRIGGMLSSLSHSEGMTSAGGGGPQGKGPLDLAISANLSDTIKQGAAGGNMGALFLQTIGLFGLDKAFSGVTTIPTSWLGTLAPTPLSLGAAILNKAKTALGGGDGGGKGH